MGAELLPIVPIEDILMRFRINGEVSLLKGSKGITIPKIEIKVSKRLLWRISRRYTKSALQLRFENLL